MSKVVDITAYSAGYRKGMEEAIEHLKEMEEQLFESALGLLMMGKWQRWADAQPIGTIFDFRVKEMLEADDRVVNELLGLMHIIREKREEVFGDGGE